MVGALDFVVLYQIAEIFITMVPGIVDLDWVQRDLLLYVNILYWYLAFLDDM